MDALVMVMRQIGGKVPKNTLLPNMDFAADSDYLEVNDNSAGIYRGVLTWFQSHELGVICGDMIFLKIDNVLPTWSHYCFKLNVDTPGTKTIVLCVHQPQEPDSKPTETELKQEFKEEDTMVADVEDISDVKVKDEDEDAESLDGVLTRCPVSPCMHLGQHTRNPDPATWDILRAQKCPWRHIVRLFEASKIPHRVVELEAVRVKSTSVYPKIIIFLLRDATEAISLNDERDQEKGSSRMSTKARGAAQQDCCSHSASYAEESEYTRALCATKQKTDSRYARSQGNEIPWMWSETEMTVRVRTNGTGQTGQDMGGYSYQCAGLRKGAECC
ncbi:hypothetical protein DEU56DRAFT_759950 [Suillus clintonianus]|uniref:uncharacterized protein n=1 Tax=Suillus clintonianus TaxID=1904413 RepID=UPI001B874A12|nr:uncharacterized protein DEU56DRAFT_759950 [Suillus clintonianus]KAG2123738.1 hypothetical protein DEU56DRAFT_759950 [Suillus clintonianus]